jgi:hypothetical protein
MTIDFTKPVLFDAANNGYMVTMQNEWPYEVLEGYPNWSDVQVWLAAGNLATPYVPPAPVPPDPVAQANATLHDLMLQYVNSIMVGPTAPKNAAAWLAAWKAAGN